MMEINLQARVGLPRLLQINEPVLIESEFIGMQFLSIGMMVAGIASSFRSAVIKPRKACGVSGSSHRYIASLVLRYW
jgi:hypothetical protein